MKSRKFKAVLAAVSAIAVLATAMTGFAATANVTTVTTYGTGDKAAVAVAVTGATPNSEVTYLVNTSGNGVSNSKIVYIDQKTASSSGAVEFNYQFDKSVDNGFDTTVTMGSGSGDTFTGDLVLGINEADSAAGTNCTITTKAYGEGDATKNVVVAANDGYEIVEVKVNGVVQSLASGFVFNVAKSAVVTAVAAPKVGDAYAYPVVSAVADSVYTAIIKAGDCIETGVYYGDVRYPAATATGITGVQINLGEAELTASDFTTYFMTDADTMYKADGTEVE